MAEFWDVVFPAAVLNSGQKHCNSANPYATYEMLSMPHLNAGDKVLFVARVKLYEPNKGSEFISYDKKFRPEIYKHCRDGDEEIYPNRNFWYFEEIDFQRRGKVSDAYYQRLLGAVHMLHKVIPTRRQRSFTTINSSLGSLYAKPTRKRNPGNILEDIAKNDPSLFDLINRAYKSYN